MLLWKLLCSLSLRTVAYGYHSLAWLHGLLRVLDRAPPKYASKASPAEWMRISDNVLVINGLNPGSHTLTGTNTYLIGTGPSRVLIDTGEGRPEYIELLKEVCSSTGCSKLQAIIITHGHFDHYAGIADIHKHLGWTPVYKLKHPEATEPYSFEYLTHDQVIQTSSGEKIRVVATPGHTSDHVSLILEPNNLLLSGDCILGLGTAVFDDLYTYMKSLSLLKTVCQSREISCILPGHGPKIEDAVGKIEEYIKHRSLRESQILDLLKSRPGEWLTSLQVSRLVYGNIPIQNLASAQRNVLHHLQKLQVENRIKHSFLDMWKIV